jgi:urea transport system ATP-binding protein
MGHNGAGKTTLLRAAIGLLKCTAGKVVFTATTSPSCGPAPRSGQLTTEENLQVVADSRKNGKQLIDEELDLFPALTELLTRRAGLLSGGQTAAAGDREGIDHVAEVSDPRRADGRHPTVGGCRDRAAITDLTKRGDLGVLLVEQHIGFALESSQRYYILESGRISRPALAARRRRPTFAPRWPSSLNAGRVGGCDVAHTGEPILAQTRLRISDPTQPSLGSAWHRCGRRILGR